MPSDSGSSTQAISNILAAYFAILGIIFLIAIIFSLVVYWRIFSKAGFNGAMSLLALVPGVGSLIVLCILAFGEWPALRELEMLRNQVRGQQGQQFPPFNQQGGPQMPSNPNYQPDGPQYPRY
ncbi:hypothetical protein KDA_23130 [Dictyobacter alpinus]|uniref:DUF805 domain-containing protein n=1 Tax=Dictyobacter alpinus TaxID=2014873 RepID=A0A402B671_9CHLR|nr:hypothetical protein [Dictyobacter alpinus]GCE26829.1 hypothetical protein KDA_23130 [Dictyobacter alpinus]